MGMPFGGLLAVSVLGLVGCSEDGRLCTKIGCHSSEAVGDIITVSESDPLALPYASIELCINERCASGTVRTKPAPPYEITDAQLTGDISAGVSFRSSTTGTTVVAHFGRDPGLKPGDVYTATITRRDGTPLGSMVWTAQLYYEENPNGSACGPDCELVDLTPVP